MTCESKSNTKIEINGAQRAYNFSAGAAMLDTEVMLECQKEFVNYLGTGMGVYEMSQRDVGGPVQIMMEKASNNMRELMQVPENYKILFFQGGAHQQFAAVPLNLMGATGKNKVDFVMGGMWSQRAAAEAAKYGEVNVALDCSKAKYKFIAPVSEWNLSDDAAYCHICFNETVNGLCFSEDPVLPEGKILVADMTSILGTRKIDISKYGCIYASFGKNLGPPGMCCVIVREDLIGKELPMCPAIMSYKLQSDCNNIYNTPNIFSLYVNEKITAKLLREGGIEVAEAKAKAKAALVHKCCDDSDGFYNLVVKDAKFKSETAIPIRINSGDEALEKKFLVEADAAGYLQLFGHFSVGGLRVCMYNGVPIECVKDLLGFMNEFKNANK